MQPPWAVAAAGPTGAAYDVVLVAHVIAALVALVVVAISAVQARRLLAIPAGAPVPASLVRYFTPGVNLVGRLLFAVPVLGFALLGMSHGSFHLADAWVVGGLVLWFAVAVGAEGRLWPAEQRIQTAMKASENKASDATGAPCREVLLVAPVLGALLVGATVLMFAK